MHPAAHFGPFEITLAAGPALDRVVVAGELDRATAPQLEAVLLARVVAQRRVVLDLTAVTFIDGGGIAVIHAAARVAHDAGCRLDVRAGEPSARLLRLVGLDRRLALI